MILGIRTDKPEAELYLIEDGKVVDSYNWHAHRQLSDTLLDKIETLLQNHKLTLPTIEGIVVYGGPGSFTGLRIGISLANTLAYSLHVPITSGTKERWLKQALGQLQQQGGPQIIIPEYGSDVHITKPRK